MYYKLVNKTPVKISHAELIDNVEYLWSEAHRRIKHDVIESTTISTIFLLLDHGTRCGGPPVLFETMVFLKDNPENRRFMQRYTTYDDAVAGHYNAVATIMQRVKQSHIATQALLANWSK